MEVENYVDLVLEIADLNSYKNEGEIIEIDKSIFDDFQVNTVIYILFVENDSGVYEYVMTKETEESIVCELMDIINVDNFLDYMGVEEDED